jgi:hypothetical protein
VWVEPTLYPQARETDRVIFADLTPNAPMQRDKPVNKAPQPVGDDRTDDPSTGGSFFGIPTE